MLIQEFYDLYWGRIEKKWLSVLNEEKAHPSVSEIVLYHLKNPGKRLRPYLSVGLSLCLNPLISDSGLDFAASVELLHNASLVHDDLEDQDFYRRGVLNVWKKYSPVQAINMGDLLFTKSLELLLIAPGIPADIKIQLIRKTISAINELIYGQMLEISFSNTVNMTWNDWEEIAAQKTGALIRLIFEGVLMLAGIDTCKYSGVLNSIGRLIGIIYQMRDDIMDATGLKEGRQQGSDILEGKMTCLSIKAMETGGGRSGIIGEILLNPGQKDDQSRIKTLLSFYEDLGITSRLKSQYALLLGQCRNHPVTESFPRIKPALDNFLDMLVIDL